MTISNHQLSHVKIPKINKSILTDEMPGYCHFIHNFEMGNNADEGIIVMPFDICGKGAHISYR